MKEIRSLTSLRGLAALFVVAYHASRRPGGAWLENPVFHHGYFAVDFFLVLSGFVLAGAYGEAATTVNGYARFLERRFFRLFPLHLAVLACIVLAHPVWTFSKVLPEGASMHRWHVFPPLEMQGPMTPLGATINAPDWSISCEWAVNLAFPLFVFLCLRGGTMRAIASAIAALTALVACAFLRHSYSLSLEGSPLPLVRSGADFALGVLSYRCRAFLLAPRWLGNALSIQPFHYLGQISYSIYLIHWPILWAFGITWQAAVLILVAPTLSYWFVERPARGLARRERGPTAASTR